MWIKISHFVSVLGCLSLFLSTHIPQITLAPCMPSAHPTMKPTFFFLQLVNATMARILFLGTMVDNRIEINEACNLWNSAKPVKSLE